MYYQRVISDALKNLLMPDGGLNWLYYFVKGRKDLDFLIGANKSKAWIYVYRGTSRLLGIGLRNGMVDVSAAGKYLDLAVNKGLKIYGCRELSDLDFKDDFERLLGFVERDASLNRYYNNKKEGYYQNLFSRQFGIESNGSEDFVVVDKEVVIGHASEAVKKECFGKHRAKFMAINGHLSQVDAKLFGGKLTQKALGNELDFLAVTREGKIYLVEFKHGSSTKGIYLAPIQIGLYYNIFTEYVSQYREDFLKNVNGMIRQKKEMGLISRSWPDVMLSTELVPVLVVAGYKESSAFNTFKQVLAICRDKLNDSTFLSGLKVYKYDDHRVLTPVPLPCI
jgi:hypothetical protein